MADGVVGTMVMGIAVTRFRLPLRLHQYLYN